MDCGGGVLAGKGEDDVKLDVGFWGNTGAHGCARTNVLYSNKLRNISEGNVILSYNWK